jgi:hypothetical protein
MAAPNLLNLTTATGKVAGLAVTTSATAIVSNGSGSGKCLKINTLIVANITGSTATVTVDLYKNATTAFEIMYQATVPANSTLVVIGKTETQLYLEENDSLRLTAASNSTLEAVCSYEDLS